MLGLAFLGFSVTLVVGLIWLFASEGIREQIKEINQLETRIQKQAKSKTDFAKQEWADLARQTNLPRFRNDPVFADKIVRGIEKKLKNTTS